VLVQALTEDPALRSVELLHRARLAGYTGGKSAVYALAQTLRVRTVTPLVRFEGLAEELSQHDVVTYQDGTETKVHFFASRLKYSRWVEVTLVPDERVETPVRAVVEHLGAFLGIPLVTVFDRPKTIALKWGRDGVVTEWNPNVCGRGACLGIGGEVCWPYRRPMDPRRFAAVVPRLTIDPRDPRRSASREMRKEIRVICADPRPVRKRKIRVICADPRPVRKRKIRVIRADPRPVRKRKIRVIRADPRPVRKGRSA
jgi:hypothetical protein